MSKETAAYLRRLLVRARLSQVAAARAIGISPRAMRRYVSLDRRVWRKPPRPVVMALEAVVAAADRETVCKACGGTGKAYLLHSRAERPCPMCQPDREDERE